MGISRIKSISAAAAIAGMVALAAWLSSCCDVVWFGGYVLLCILLPGKLLFDHSRNLNGPLRFLLCFYGGFSVAVMLYYLCCLLQSFWPLKLIPLVLGIFELGKLIFSAYREGVRRYLCKGWEKASRNHAAFWCVLLAMLASAAVLFYLFATPNMVWNPDYQWHMGNIYTLADSFNFADIRAEGLTFTYHYFSDLFFAIGRIIFGLEPYQCAMRFPILLTGPLVISSVSALLAYTPLRSWNARAGVALAGMLLTPLFGPNNDLAYQWLTNINAVGLAMPCGLTLICLLLHFAQRPQREGVTWKTGTLCILLMLLTAGLKGPFALAILGGVCGYTLYLLIKRQKLLKGWYWLVAGLCLAFLLIWITLLRFGLNEDYGTQSAFLDKVYKVKAYIPIVLYFGDSWKTKLLMLPLHFFAVTGILSLPFLAVCIRYVTRLFRHECPSERGEAILLCLCVSSLGVYYLFDMTGQSQNYFLYFSIPCMLALAVQETARWLAALYRKKRVILRRCLAGAMICLAAVNMTVAAMNPALEDRIEFYTPEILQGVDWIRENTSPDAKLAVNRHGSFYLLSGFTGRRFKVEGVLYARNSGATLSSFEQQMQENDRLFDPEYPDKLALAKALGIDYTVYVVRTFESENDEVYDPSIMENQEGFELCFSNRDIVIYQVVDTE